jgi:hypothetical protein
MEDRRGIMELGAREMKILTEPADRRGARSGGD